MNEVSILYDPSFGAIGSREYQVASGTTSSIEPGQPVVRTLGSPYVALAADNMPVVGTDYVVGIAMSTSTETASAAGKVQVMPLVPGQVWLCAPNDSTLWDTQAEYDALVGDRVLFDLTAGVFSVLATDNANNGLVVEQLDIKKIPNKVAFAIRNGASYLA